MVSEMGPAKRAPVSIKQEDEEDMMMMRLTNAKSDEKDACRERLGDLTDPKVLGCLHQGR